MFEITGMKNKMKAKRSNIVLNQKDVNVNLRESKIG